jgi:ABC-type transport system involved in cytochrome bd biosynthesis fused ATPase/permease subunit
MSTPGTLQPSVPLRTDAHGQAVTPAVELREVYKRFGKTEIIRGASLSVAPGERVAIIGPNGAGKSTLFNLISGRFGASSGDILLNGRKIDGLKPYEINRLGLARSFQVSNLLTTCRSSRTCAAPSCGAWVTATPSGSSSASCTTPTNAPNRCWP